MRAYAILDGGGVNGAALAGCLKAAEEVGIEFVGYGGTSAGAIVALLASLGYTPDDLKVVLCGCDFGTFLDDSGGQLQDLRKVATLLGSGAVGAIYGSVVHLTLLRRLKARLGLYSGRGLVDFLVKKCQEKVGPIEMEDLTFEYLARQSRPPIRIVASDLRSRAPRVFGHGEGGLVGGSVIDAVRASMSYPMSLSP